MRKCEQMMLEAVRELLDSADSYRSVRVNGNTRVVKEGGAVRVYNYGKEIYRREGRASVFYPYPSHTTVSRLSALHPGFHLHSGEVLYEGQPVRDHVLVWDNGIVEVE